MTSNTDTDDIFTPAGLACALHCGVTVSVSVGSATRDVRLTDDNLTCRDCGKPFDVPADSPASFLARKMVLTDGVCVRCDPPDNPVCESLP